MNQAEAGKLGAIASRETIQQLKLARIAEYYKNPKLCPCCGKPIAYERKHLKFCNSSCAAKYNNPRSHVKKYKVLNTCVNCGKQTYNAKFCSKKCSYDYTWKLTKKSIEENSKIRMAPTYRKYLLEKYGNSCMICHRTEWEGHDIPLILDHINGDSTDCDLSNLRMICPNCDALLATYKGRNINGKRKYRNERYKRKYC